jgi:hypothetical protein
MAQRGDKAGEILQRPEAAQDTIEFHCRGPLVWTVPG